MRQRAPRVPPQRGREEPPARLGRGRREEEGAATSSAESGAPQPHVRRSGEVAGGRFALCPSLSLWRTQLRVRARGAAVPRCGEPLRERRGAGGAPCGPTSCGLLLPAPLAERRGEEAQSLRAAVRGRPAGGRAAAGRDGAVRGCAAGLSRCPFGDPRGEQLLESPAASSIAFTLFGISVLRPRVLLRVGDEWGAAFVQPGGGSENLRKAFKGEPGRGEPR